nr:hypothetical protein [Picobirnavirus sp.]UVJ88927.1 hypothetical protein [Picobirnavirus sp.]
MLAVQVNYQGIQETAKHNRESERQGKVQLEQNWTSIAEQKRHNLATEELTAKQIAEQGRHNRATESLGYANLAYSYSTLSETTRANKARESLQQYANYTNRMSVIELGRHNRTTESLAQESNAISAFNARTQRMRTENDYTLGWGNLVNQRRANEINQQRANTAQFEAATNRARQEQDYKFGSVHAKVEVAQTGIKGLEALHHVFQDKREVNQSLFESVIPFIQ